MNILLIPLSVIFCLSLIGAIVLFKYLKSHAKIERKTWQASGALAGFILIYWLLTSTFNGWYQPPPECWTITGMVTVKGWDHYSGITVKYIPALQHYTDESGYFEIKNLPRLPENWLIIFEYEDESKEKKFDRVQFDELDESSYEINRKERVLDVKNIKLPRKSQ